MSLTAVHTLMLELVALVGICPGVLFVACVFTVAQLFTGAVPLLVAM